VRVCACVCVAVRVLGPAGSAGGVSGGSAGGVVEGGGGSTGSAGGISDVRKHGHKQHGG